MRTLAIAPDPDVAVAIFRVTGGNPELSETGTTPVPVVVVTSDDVTVLGPPGVSIVFMICDAPCDIAYVIAALVVVGDVATTVVTPCKSVILEGVVGSDVRRVGIAPVTELPITANPNPETKVPENNAKDEPMLYVGVLTTKIPVPSILQVP
jgi:hypothetical protein